MKKCFLFIAALVLALSLVGCEAFYYGTVVDGIIPKDGITIVTTNFSCTTQPAPLPETGTTSSC